MNLTSITNLSKAQAIRGDARTWGGDASNSIFLFFGLPFCSGSARSWELMMMVLDLKRGESRG